jgi:hypothetical protein
MLVNVLQYFQVARFIMKFHSFLVPAFLATQVVAITEANAEAAYTTLQQWYNQSIGLWIPSTGW